MEFTNQMPRDNNVWNTAKLGIVSYGHGIMINIVVVGLFLQSAMEKHLTAMSLPSTNWTDR